MDQELVYFDGEYLAAGAAGYPVWERGVMFADGVYEVLRYESGVAFEVDRHMARLRRSLAGIGLAVSEGEIEGWVAASDGLVERNGWGSGGAGGALVYWQVTRGFVGVTHPAEAGWPGERVRRSHVMVPAAEQRAVVMMMGSAVEPVLGLVGSEVPCIDVISVADRRWGHCWIKSLMLLPNSAAKTAAEDGWVTEGASTNVLMVRDGELWTAPESRWILSGVTRGVLLEEAEKLGVRVREDWFTLAELRAAEEVMVCGTGTMLARVGRVDGEVVGDTAPQPSAAVGFEGGVAQALWEGLVGRVCRAARPVASDRVKQRGSSGAAV